MVRLRKKISGCLKYRLLVNYNGTAFIYIGYVNIVLINVIAAVRECGTIATTKSDRARIMRGQTIKYL